MNYLVVSSIPIIGKNAHNARFVAVMKFHGITRSPCYYHALAGVFPAKDIVVYTPKEVKEWSDVPNAFVTVALREGKILYGDVV